jgi:hypothetical protein
MKVIKIKFITRGYVQQHRNALFVFGDNLAGFGLAGQAQAMRGEVNAIGIATKIYPLNRDVDYFDDNRDWNTISLYYNALFKRIEYLSRQFEFIVVPEDGLGTGYSKMQEKCPRLLVYLNEKLKELEQL